jgi:uncharacterized tellurite resistance protein B-like protein
MPMKAIPHNPMEGDVERPAPVVLPISMFRRLLGLFDDAEVTRREIAAGDPLQRAAAVLLVIAARLDGRMDSHERASIERLLVERLDVTEAAALIEEAEKAAANTTDFFGVTRIINKQLPPEQRVGVIEMLWQVVYADGAVHDYEANLVRRVAGLLHVSDRDAGEARKRVTVRQRE